jgi:hypothetical protein
MNQVPFRVLSSTATVFVSLSFLVNVVWAEDWHCRNGKTYENVRYMRHNLTAVQFSHSSGISVEKFSNLPDDIQKRYGYDSQREEQVRIKHKKELEEQQRKEQELQEAQERREAQWKKEWEKQQAEIQKRNKYECIQDKTDEFRGLTTISLGEALELEKTTETKLIADVFYIVGASDIHMHFASIRDSSNDWRFLDYHPVYFLVDGDRWNPTEEYDSDVLTSSHTLYETISIEIPMERMKSIVHAQSVKFKIGISEFNLSKDHQDKIGILLEYLHEKYDVN